MAMSSELHEFSDMIDERFELADITENENWFDRVLSWFL